MGRVERRQRRRVSFAWPAAWRLVSPLVSLPVSPTTSNVSRYLMRALSPQEFHWRAPFFADVVSPDNITFNADVQSVFDKEMEYANTAGLSYFAFDQ